MRVKLLLTVLLLALGPACRPIQSTPNVGDQAPSFSLPDTAGVKHSIADWRGKVVVLTFWQSS